MKKKKSEVGKMEKEPRIVESFLGGLPVFGDFFKELAKTETFEKRFKEVDEKIEENLKKGERKRWGFEANLSIRPIFDRKREESSEISLHEDHIYGKKGNQLLLAVKSSDEDADLVLKGKNLLITSGNFTKKIELPDYYREVKKKQYREGVLVLELTK